MISISGYMECMKLHHIWKPKPHAVVQISLICHTQQCYIMYIPRHSTFDLYHKCGAHCTVCNTFTPQIKGISDDAYVSHVYFSTGIHLNVHRCTFKCIPGKWLHFKRPSHYHVSKDCNTALFFFIQTQTKFNCGSKFNA